MAALCRISRSSRLAHNCSIASNHWKVSSTQLSISKPCLFRRCLSELPGYKNPHKQPKLRTVLFWGTGAVIVLMFGNGDFILSDWYMQPIGREWQKEEERQK